MPITQPENLIAKPFCFNAESGIDYQIPPFDSPNPAIVTQAQGYPKQQAEPLDGGGEPVDRSQTNGIERIITENIAFATCGGLYTFNEIVSTRNNGYQRGAVLFDYVAFDFVISLKDNNTDNFVTNPNYINDESWSYLGYSPKCGTIQHSFQKNNYVAGRGMWMIANGQAIPPQYTQAIAMFGTNLPNFAGRVLAMADTNHAPKTTAGSETVDAPLPEHKHEGTHVHIHGIAQMEHNHAGFDGNERRQNGDGNQSTRLGGAGFTTYGSNANISIGLPNTPDLTIETAGVKDPKINVIQPTFYVENIFIYCC